jgi:cytochrome c peroxidase
MPMSLRSLRASSFVIAASLALAVSARALEGAPPVAAERAGNDEASLTPLQLLGKRIFEDKTLSRPAGVSCASCHDPDKAFTGDNGSPIAAVARGARPGAYGTRNVPGLMYTSFSPPFAFVDKKDEKTGAIEKAPIGGQFLDGRAADLLQQFEGPLLNPYEMNNPSKRAVVEAVRDGAYADLVRRVHGEKVFADLDAAFEKLAQAVVAFENTERFHPFASKFDLFLRGAVRLSPLEAKGFALFKNPGKGNCIACHVGKEDSREPKDWLFTDFTYDALGAPRNGAIPANAKPGAPADLGLCKREGLEKAAPKGFDIESLCGAFKVPTLRNVAVTGPYLHNGVFTKLRDAVAFYATRDTKPERWYRKNASGAVEKYDDLPAKYHDNVNVKEVPYDRRPGQKPRLSDREIDAIAAFLETLSDKSAAVKTP